MTDQVFELENFRGPLDLLLHLIREQEMEITAIDLSKLCDQYLVAVELMKAVDINVAGEFLVMASTLVLIKSRSLLPREEEIDLEQELDPADELIQQLLEYRKYKSLSLELGRRAEERSLRHERGGKQTPPDEENTLEEIGLWDLVGTFARLLEELGLRREFHTLRQEKPLRAYIREVIDRLGTRERWSFSDLIRDMADDGVVFGVFLALLELVKSRQVRVVQERRGEEIFIELRQDRDPARLGLLSDEEQPEADAEEPTPPEPQPGDPPERTAGAAAETSTDLAASEADAIVSPLVPPTRDEQAGR